MKKLMIVAAVAMVAIASNAAQYTWKSASGYIYDGNSDSPAKLTSGQAYLFNAGTYSQATLLAAFAGGATLDSLVANAVTTSGGTIGSNGQIASSPEFSYSGVEVGDTWTAYYAVQIGEKLFISTVKGDLMAMNPPDVTPINFGTMTASSKKTIGEASKGYTEAGWYTTASVPEPTSGLLLLLGVAGMALRRRHA